MSEGQSSETIEFVLPFAVLSQNRKEPFTPDLEIAAIFALSELQRMKGGGIIVKQPEEKILFVAKAYYPLWLFPSGERALIFDGLKRDSYTIEYAVLPDVKGFLEELRRSSKTLETSRLFSQIMPITFKHP
jgi:hypothetical protein